MNRNHATLYGDIPFTAEEELEADQREAAYLAQLQAEVIPNAVSHFVQFTDAYIQAKIDQWNIDNAASGTKFDNIHSFPKYAVIPTDSRYDISVRFLTWNGKVWDALRTYQATLTTIPTDAEVKAVLDAVVF